MTILSHRHLQVKINKIGMSEMSVNDSEMSLKQRSLVNTGDVSPKIA